jgi:hypothetical protein
MSTSNHIQMTLIDSNQSSPEVTANAALVKLEESHYKELAVAMADANQTLSDAQYNGYGVYTCTGALTAQRDLIVPTRERKYCVQNSTSGGYGVQVKTSGGTGIVIPAGGTAVCYTDGTNVISFGGGGVGGAVSSVHGRTGAVVAVAGDYGPTTGGTGQTSWAKGDLLAGTGTNTLGKLTVGTDGYILTADAAETAGVKWVANTGGMTNPMTTAGDIIVGGSSGTPARLAAGTDGEVLTLVSGTPSWEAATGGSVAWLDYHPDKPPSSPNAMDDEFDAGSLNTSLWTWGNQGTSTATQANSRLTLEGQVSGGDNIRYIYQTLPAAPCEFTAKIGFPRPSGSVNYMLAGIGIRYAAGDDFFLGGWTNNGDPYIMSATFNTATSSATNGVQSAAAVFVPPMYWRMKVTAGTDVDFSYSIDGVNFIRQRSMPFGTAFAGNSPDQVLLFSNPNNTTASATLVVEWFRRTA